MVVTAIAINCTLKASGGEPSSTDKMIGLIAGELKKRGVEVRGTIRIADHDIKPGVTSDEGPGDAWPDIRRKILDCDILIFGTPIWLDDLVPKMLFGFPSIFDFDDLFVEIHQQALVDEGIDPDHSVAAQILLAECGDLKVPDRAWPEGQLGDLDPVNEASLGHTVENHRRAERQLEIPCDLKSDH